MALNGEFTPPGDKSISHRLVLMSLLAEGEMAVSGLSDCDDVKVSLSLFRALGGRAQGGGSRWTLGGLGGLLSVPQWEAVELDCGNSGTTMRLLSGVLAGIPGKYILDGDQQLRRRPMERLADPLRQMGARLDTNNGRAPLTIEGGPLHGLEYVNSDASAQLKGALLLAALQASGPSKIIEPRPTRDHTERLINLFGGQVCTNNAPQNTALEIQPGRLTLAPELAVPGDPSSAAFFLIGAAMMPGSWVTAANMLLSSARIGFLKVLDRMGANISISLTGELPEPNGRVTVEYNGPLMATELGAED
ncbi:MAG: 3-phosphoshikimate 1-carboxyvinyltransferase, partial [Candidatus Adiutrix sp.]|nr:3-phosphoshikimate 1-carboxyvinyltransferase [Candidatus Adiutrix sp.]